MTTLPKSIANLQKLNVLTCKNNPFSEIPSGIFSLINLTRLDLEGTLITELNDEINNLENLKDLRITHKEPLGLKISSAISSLKQLNSLYLQNLGLKELPECILNLTSLEYLYLDNNNLTSLPEKIGKLKNLRSLSLKNNNIASLPKSLSQCDNLKDFEYNDNPFMEYYRESLSKYRKLIMAWTTQWERKIHFIRKLVSINLENEDEIKDAICQSIIHDDSVYNEPDWFKLNKIGWNILELDYWDVSYKIGKYMEEWGLKAQKTYEFSFKYDDMVGYGRDLAASSLLKSNNIEDIKRAISLFEQARDLSEKLYTKENYDRALKKLEILEKNYNSNL